MADLIDRKELRDALYEADAVTMQGVKIINQFPAVNAAPVVRCMDCKHINVLNRKELYAHCPKTNTVFLPFELDIREHFCSLGERKDGADNG